MLISKLYLGNWRNFKLVDVSLQQRVFLAGPNASGKSNFLDAIRFLQDVAREGGGLQKAVNDRGGVSRIRCLAARQPPDVALRVKLRVDGGDTKWVYTLAFSHDKKKNAPIITSEIVKLYGNIILERPDENDERDRDRLTQTHLQQVSANKEFREIAEFLETVRYLHIVPQLVRDMERAGGRSHDPFGGDFLEQLARAPKKHLESRLSKITEALTIAVPQLRELKLERDKLGTPHLYGRYEHWRPRAGWQAEDQFSDGTLRLIGLLWAVAEGAGPLLLEEPELSLHPSVVRFIPQMLARVAQKSRRQVFLSTHSPELLADSGIAPDEVLLLYPSKDGTEVIPAKDDENVRQSLEAGENMADAVLVRVAPERPDRLAGYS